MAASTSASGWLVNIAATSSWVAVLSLAHLPCPCVTNSLTDVNLPRALFVKTPGRFNRRSCDSAVSRAAL
jgi:hypothetical protein